MPRYQYRCPSCGYECETVRSIKHIDEGLWCSDCNKDMEIVIQVPILVKAAADVRYDSPIDGRPITNWQARQEDLKRNTCVEYDPEQKTDYHRREKESEASLEKAIDATVEEVIEKMPTKERGKLHSELVDQGMTVGVTHA